MNNFIHAVAADILKKHGNDLSRTAVVFPNKRAALFMNEQLARLTDRPLWSPSYITISDLFRRHSTLQAGDPILLISLLHRVFTEVTGIDETIDHFYGWGQLLLADFDDIDKNMADASRVFANLRDLHELDSVDYLSEKQKELLHRFFKNFSSDNKSELKERFLHLWSRFHEIYCTYNETLRSQGIAYEGALYREVAENKELQFEYDRYIFVGFNLLQQVEQQLFSRLKSEGKAFFYWDYDHYYKDNPDNEAGHYIREYLKRFPNELDDSNQEIYSCFSGKKDISFVSSQTENAQARFVTQWLQQKGRIEAGKKTAIVLCDESLLPAVIHCLPPEVSKVNITTGYPLAQSPFSTLVSLLVDLQTLGHVEGTDKYRLRHVLRILRHPYAPLITPHSHELIVQLTGKRRLYLTRQQLSVDEGAQLLFRECNENLLEYLLDVLKLIAANTSPNSNSLNSQNSLNSLNSLSPFSQESLFRMYTLLNRLYGLVSNGSLNIELPTLQRLIGQLIDTTSIPFHGEPAEGLQIMGVLETRNLDFDHILLLSCNEGNMPKGVNDTSFVPYAIRKAYGLTTIDNKVAVYAYYFNRLLQRAQDVTILYNNATEEGQTGQMSRFMLQLLVESGHPILQENLKTQLSSCTLHPSSIEKDDAIMQLLSQIKSLSPTAINRYLRCPLQFYYNLLADLKEPDENDDDEIDNRIFGNIFHRSAELIYLQLTTQSRLIRKGDIQGFIKNRNNIERIVDQAFKEELFKADSNDFTPEYNGLQLINREVIIGFVEQLLKLDEQLAPFTVIALEHKVYTKLDLAHSSSPSITIGGIIDRIDLIHSAPSGEPEENFIRVLDYKTGRPAQQVIASLEDIFSGENISQRHADYYLQAMLYASIVRHSDTLNPKGLPVAPALLFIQHAGTNDYNPILTLGNARAKQPINDIATFENEFRSHLTELVGEIFNPEVPFTPTADTGRCTNCPYKKNCRI